MSVQIERVGFDHEFFRVGLSILEGYPERFYSLSIQGLPTGGPSVEPRRVEAWREFLSGKKRSVVFSEDVTVDQIYALFWQILDEVVNRPTKVVLRTGPSVEFSSFSRTKSSGDRYEAAGDRTSGLPKEVPVVVSDDRICYGCGKGHPESIGWRLQIGPFDVPCCPGRGEFDVKKACRFEALEKLSACPSCGQRSFETRGGGRICRDCSALIDAGEEARKLKGATASVSVYRPNVPHDLQKAVTDVLSAFGGTKGKDGYVVPELVVPDVSALCDRIDKELVEQYSKGLDKGRNLLLGLADGTVSISEFD